MKQSRSVTNNYQQSSATSKRANPNIYNHNRNAKLVKQYFNLEEILANPEKTRLYIDKLNGQISDRDNNLKQMNSELEKTKQELKIGLARNANANSNVNSHNDSDEPTEATNSNSKATNDQ